MHLSVREVMLLSQRCFMANGFDEGAAEARAAAFRWAEVYKESGITTLHDVLDDLPEFEQRAVSLSEHSTKVAVLDAADQPSIVANTPALDMCCSQTDKCGTGMAYATIAEGDPTSTTVGHVAYKAAQRGLVTIVLYTDGDGESKTVIATPDIPHPRLVEVDLPEPSVSYAKVVDVISAGLCKQPNEPLLQAIFKRDERHKQPTADERLVQRLLEQSIEPAARSVPGDDGGFVTLGIDPRHPHHPVSAQHIVERFLDENEDAFTYVFDPDEIHERVGTLLEEGVPVDEGVWRDVFDESSEVLAPEFEGSLEGAGFDINE